MKFTRFTLVAAAMVFGANRSMAQIIFEDGGENVVNSSISDHIIVRDSSMGMPTIVLIQTGADIPTTDPDGTDTSIFVEGNSVVEMTDGMTVGGFNVFDNSIGILAGGIVGDEVEVYGESTMTIGTPKGSSVPDIQDDLETFGEGRVDMYEGRVFDDVESNDSSVINFFGGEFDEDIEAFDNSTITIFGGEYSTGFGDLDDIEGGKIEVQNDDDGNVNTALINVRGGMFTGALFDPDFKTEGEGTLMIFGTDFQVDGADVEYGLIDATSGQLTGTLADGSPVDNDFEHIIEGGEIILALIGDINCDGEVSLADIPQFVEVLVGDEYQTKADLNADGLVSLQDIPLFVELLSGG